MNMSPEGREWVYWVLGDAPDGGLEVSFDRGVVWHPLERDTEAGTARILLAGPEAEDNPPETVVLPLGRTVPLIRSTHDPEVLVRESPGPVDIA